MKNIFLIPIFIFSIILSPYLEAVSQEELYDFLTEYDSSKEKKDWDWNRLAYAIEKEYVGIAAFFVKRGEVVERYIEIHPSDPNKTNPSDGKLFDYYYKHPLITAIRKGYNNIAKIMISNDLDLSLAIEKKLVRRKSGTNDNKQIYIHKYPAFFIVLKEGIEDISLVQYFIEFGMKLNEDGISFQGAPNETQTTTSLPLHLAIGYHRLDTARFLLETGADISLLKLMVNKDVKYVYTPIIGTEEYTPGSPLYVAVKGNYLEGVKLLLEYGADPLQPHPNNTCPLDLAIKQGNQEIIELLLEACCD